ncbi:MAG: NADH-quinone oxidoreductase subunit J [Caldilineaceae bacterium]|nr:NADH-quinone oxidoreductase subunit J [Caldilineaceae bacterium]
MMTLPLLFFIVVGAVSLAAATGVVVSRQPVHSALFLLTHFVTLAVMYVALEAQFLAAAQVIIYAGGIVILILFVIMLIGSEKIETRAGHRIWTPYVGLLLGIVLIASLANAILGTPLSATTNTAIQGGDPKVLGFLLYTRYLLPFELAAVLLLVGLLGALLLGRRPHSDLPDAQR